MVGGHGRDILGAIMFMSHKDAPSEYPMLSGRSNYVYVLDNPIAELLTAMSLKVLPHKFFGGRRSSAGSRLFALLLGSCLLSASQRTSPFSGNSRHTTARVSPNLILQSKSTRARVRGYNNRTRGREVRREAREGGRCAEVHANWRS